jgi:hypothetical protein
VIVPPCHARTGSSNSWVEWPPKPLPRTFVLASDRAIANRSSLTQVSMVEMVDPRGSGRPITGERRWLGHWVQTFLES